MKKLIQSNFIIVQTIFIIGAIFLAIGFYYIIVKAGLPYQDPTEEMLYMYHKNMYIGEHLVIIGFFIELIGIILCLFKYPKIISIICSAIGIVLSLSVFWICIPIIRYSLGWVGVISSTISLIICTLDLLTTVGEIKSGLIYSCISCLIKIVIIIFNIIHVIFDYDHNSYIYFSYLFILLLIPSVLNFFRFVSLKKRG